MNPKELRELTDEELLQEAKKMKSASVLNALLIGILSGIVIYSVVKNTWGLATLIPLFFVYKMINNSKYKSKELQSALRERNLNNSDAKL